MADIAHAKTDQKLEEMEKRLSAIYSRAEKEIQETAEKYFAKFKEKDDKYQKKYESGKMSKEEYKQWQHWRRSKVTYGKKFTDMKEQCAQQLLHVNETAVAYINGELPEVYALNYNALAGSVDGVGGYSFTLVDADTVRNLAVTDTSLLPYKKIDPEKDIPWNMKKINAETLQGILQGESMDKIAKRLRNVQEMNKTQAIRSARTIVTGAENKGRQDSYSRAEADGIILQKEWLATNDGRTRHSHAVLDGAIVDQDKKFDNGLMYPGDPSGRPEEVYNCFVGETKVASDSDVVRSYKHKYDGKIISIKTAGGVQFSCTPNHPILTPNGWVAAELLNNGNNILVTFGENNVFSRINPNINHRFPRIDTIHKFGKKLRSKRTSCLGVDFHGDVATSNVEIITHKRFLGNVRYSSGRNGIDKFLLKLSNKTLSSLGSLFEHFWSVCKTSFGFIGCKCKSLSFFKCGVSHSCEHGFGTIANRDGVLTEYSINDLPADTVIDGELLDRLSCKVFLDTIVNVDVSVLSTHVYNLQTENGYYFVNSIVPQDAEKSNGIFAIAKNCRCTLVAKVNGFKKVQVQKAMAEKPLYDIMGVSEKDIDISALPTETQKLVEDSVRRSVEKFPQLKGHFTRIEYDESIDAIASSKSITGSVKLSKKFKDYQKLQKEYDYDVRLGWHPKGTTAQSTITHEIGHQLDGLLTKKGIYGGSVSQYGVTRTSVAVQKEVLSRIGLSDERLREIRKQYSDKGYKGKDLNHAVQFERKEFIEKHICSYAAENSNEFFACLYAEYMDSPEPREAATVFGEILERIMGEIK